MDVVEDLLIKIGFEKVFKKKYKDVYFFDQYCCFKTDNTYSFCKKDIDGYFREIIFYTIYYKKMLNYLNSMFKHQIRKQKINNIING